MAGELYTFFASKALAVVEECSEYFV